MATTVTPPASSAMPNMSVFDQIGSALSDPASSEPSQAEETIQTEPAGEQTENPDIQATDTDATSELSADATASPDQPTQEEINPYDQPDGEVPKQTLDVILQTPRGREIYQNHKALKEFAKPFDQGGLGFVPTVEQAREHFMSHRGRVLMESDLNSGNPQQVNNVIAHIFNPQQRGEAAQVFASRIAPMLATLAQDAQSQNPQLAAAYQQAYTSAATPFLSTYSTALWDRWTEMPDGPAGSEQARAKAAIGYAAQVLEHDLTGKYRDPGGRPAQAQPGQEDPLADQRAELEAREQRVAQFQQHQQQTEVQRISQGINAQIGSALNAEFEKALAPLKALYKEAPKKYARALKEFHEDVMRDVPKNQHAWDILQRQYQEAIRTRSPEAIQAVAKEYVRLATPVIKAKRIPFLNEEGAVVQQQNNAQHDSLRSTASHTTPVSNGGGARSPAPLTNTPKRPDEPQDQYLRRLIRGA